MHRHYTNFLTHYLNKIKTNSQQIRHFGSCQSKMKSWTTSLKKYLHVWIGCALLTFVCFVCLKTRHQRQSYPITLAMDYFRRQSFLKRNHLFTCDFSHMVFVHRSSYFTKIRTLPVKSNLRNYVFYKQTRDRFFLGGSNR